MAAQGSANGIGATFAWLDAGFSWWIGELRDMAPRGLLEFWEGGNSTIDINVLPSEIIVAKRAGGRITPLARVVRDSLVAQTLARAIPRDPPALSWLSDPVILRLTPDGALERKLRLPLAARRDLPDILRHEVERQSPVGAANIYYDYLATPDAEGLDVILRMVRRDDVDNALELCRSAGVDPSSIAFAEDDAPATGGTFPVSPQAARAFVYRRRLVPILAACVAALTLCLVGATYLRGQAVLDDLSDRVDTAHAAARSVERMQNQIASSERGAALLSKDKRSPAAVQVLSEVSRVLPNGAWLYEFELSQGEVRIHGFAHAAASLIAAFDASPMFSDAQFRSPLMQGPSGDLERFDMSFKVRPVS
ncbi:MAG TPA: PilN domain-containing protein [Rhizomicrobium sp.]